MTYRENPKACGQTLFICTQIIANLGNLLDPFIPESSGKVRSFLSLYDPKWETVQVPAGRAIKNVIHLFERISTDKIQEEEERLKNQLDRI